MEISTPRLLYQITYENYFRHEIDLNEGFVGKCAYLLKAFCICLLLIDPFEIWWMKVWRQCKRSCRGIYMLQNCQGWVEWHQRMASCRLAWHKVRNKQIVDKYYKPQHLMVFRNETKISRKGKFSERDWQSGFAGSAGLWWPCPFYSPWSWGLTTLRFSNIYMGPILKCSNLCWTHHIEVF